MSAPFYATAGEQLAVNPTKLLLHGGIEHVNAAFESRTGIKVTMPDNPEGCGATVLGLKTGKLDAGLMCCPPNKEEMGPQGLIASAAAKDGLVFSVHASNPVKQLTTEQARGIFQGKITNWKEVGGQDAPITPYAYIMCPPREDAWRQLVVGVRDYKNGIVGIDNSKLAPSLQRVDDGPPINESVAKDPNSIGLSSTAYLPVTNVRFVALDGVAPTAENIANGFYPAVRYLYMVTKGFQEGGDQAIHRVSAQPRWPGTDRRRRSTGPPVRIDTVQAAGELSPASR